MLQIPSNTKSIHVYDESLSFPVFIYARNEWEEVQISYLNHNFDNAGFTTLALCQWCESHHICYQIIYYEHPCKLIFKDFNRFLCYLYLKIKGY